MSSRNTSLAHGSASPTRRGDRAQLAYTKLRQLIVQGRLAPGMRIVESDVAERLQMSRTPVRSALQRLQNEGYVFTSGKGSQSRLTVAPLTQADAFELFSIVGEIEGLAARWSADLSPQVRDSLVDTMERLNEEMLRSSEERPLNPTRTAGIDARFHRAYVEAGAGPRLLALHDAIKPQAERYIQLYYNSLTDEVRTSIEEHRVIIARIAEGDADGAQGAVQHNWRSAAVRLRKVITDVGERGIW